MGEKQAYIVTADLEGQRKRYRRDESHQEVVHQGDNRDEAFEIAKKYRHMCLYTIEYGDGKVFIDKTLPGDNRIPPNRIFTNRKVLEAILQVLDKD